MVLLLAACWCLAVAGNAQQDTGRLLGTVTDSSGGAIPGASVRVLNETTDQQLELKTNETGGYSTPPLKPGHYAVVVESQGFQRYQAKGIVLDAAASLTIDAHLSVGEVTESVSVQATPPTLNLSDGQINNTIDTRAAQEFPINGRSVLALATITPGVVSGVGATSQGFGNRGSSVSAIRISGGVSGVNNNLLDGISNIQTFTGEIGINVKADAIQEFNILTGVAPAQFGYTSGGVINVITRSGGNRFHGSLYEFLRNDYFDAVIAFPRPTFGKPPLRFNNYGGSLGGRILRDKLFFFTNYEEYRYRSVTPSYTTVPTAAMQQGDFSGARQLVNGVCTPINIFDPRSAGTTGARTQFTGNMIPRGRMDPVALAYQTKFYPLPNNTSGVYNSCTNANNYVISPKQITDERVALGRLDYIQNQSNSYFLRYAWYQNQQNNAAGYSPLYNRNDNDAIQNVSLNYTHTFSPRMVNTLRVGGMRVNFTFRSAVADQDVAGQIGLPNSTPYNGPLMSNGLIQTNGIIGLRTNTMLDLQDDVLITRGNHTITFGAQYRFSDAYNYQTSGNSGTYSFSANQTASGNNTSIVAGTGSQYASFLLGAVQSGSNTLISGVTYRKPQYAGYIQDAWRATPRFTLNAGLRYDFQPQAWEKNNKLGNVDLSAPNGAMSQLKGLVQYAGLGYGRNFGKENFNDWGPRISFALVLDKSNRTALRGGYAIYYASTAEQYYDQSTGSTNGFSSLTTSFPSTTAQGPAFQLSNGFPGTVSPPLGAAGGQTAFLGQNVYTINPRQKSPSSQQYTLTFSRELPLQTVLDVTYLGNYGRRYTLNLYNTNTLDPQYFSLGTAVLNAQVANPYAGMVPGSLGSATVTRATTLRPYPYYNQVLPNYARQGTSNGNFLYVTLNRRVQNGLQVIGSYTYGKLMDLPIFTSIATTPGGGLATSNGPQNWRRLSDDYSVDTFDVTHRLTISALYNLPFGKGQRYLTGGGLLSYFVGGWQYNVVFTGESGRPLLISGANNQGIATRPNFKSGVSLKVANPSRDLWFNPQAFVNPPDYSFGNVPRTYSKLRGPGQQNFDMSIFKNTKIREGLTLQLRIEAFNALNRTNLQNPNTSFVAGAPADPSNPTAQGGSNTNSNFGVITSANAARIVQLAGKIVF